MVVWLNPNTIPINRQQPNARSDLHAAAALRAQAKETSSGAEFGCCISFSKFGVDYSDVYVVVYDVHSIVLGIPQGGSLEMYILDTISLALLILLFRK
jgi:hypothetical protein